MATIADQKSALVKWTPVILFDVTLKDGTPRFWAKQVITFAGNPYLAIVLEHSELKIEGNGVYGVDAVTQISLTLNNVDANLNALIAPANWQGGIIQPRFIFVAPDGTTTTDSIVYPKFLIDLPTATWPRVEFSAHNKWNLARKMLPVSLVTKKDRYPFPDTDAERASAGSDPGSEFFAIGYDPATGKGNWKTPPSTPYRRHEYDGTREKLKEIGLEVRYGGFGKVPPSIIGTPKKGEKAEYVGNANEAKYGSAVPLLFGTCRTQPIVLDTGFPSAWNGSRLSHYLLSDGVNFGPEHTAGFTDVLDVFIPDNPKYQRIPKTSNEPQTTGAWSFQAGSYGSQKAPASSKYRNIDPATDFPTPAAEFPDRDLYSGLGYLEVGFPKELSGQDGIGPKLEAIVKGLKIETWDSGGSSTWQWTDNPVWIFVHLLKLLRWTTAEMDKAAIYQAAAYCDGIVPSGKKRFRCNLPLTSQTRAADILRGIRNNCRMYTSFAADGKLQLKIAQNVAGEGGLAFALDNTNIMRGDDGQLQVEKFHRLVFETANIFTVSFQNEDNKYNIDSFTRVDVQNVNQIDEKIPADSIFPIIGIPSFDQAERQIECARQEQVPLNEYYRVTCSLALIEAKVGQVGTITEARHALISQQVRIRAMGPGRDAGTVELVLQKHSDGAYTDQSVSTPFTRAQADSSYTPRSVGGKTAASPAPILTEVTVADPINADTSIRRIKVEFKPPEQNYEGIFSRATKIRDVVVATSGGSIPGGQVLFVEVAPIKALARGLASEYLIVVVPSGGNSNSFSFTCELPPEADQYIAYVGNFPGQTYEQTVAASPGTAPFTVTIPNLARNFGSIPPDPAFDHVQIFYSYNSSPDVLRDGGRTFTPSENVVEFEPEAPAAEDTQVTVYVSSVNAAEDDFYPINISPKATLTLTYENGPAQGWTATLLPGPTPSSVVAKFTRPTVNGKRLFWVAAQVKDSGTGAWRELDSNAGAAVTYYDGSAIAHESIGGLKIKKDPGQPVGFGTAKIDDLIMLDVAGGSFDKDRCQWGTVEKFLDDLGAETTAANARYIALTGGLFRPQTTQDLRMKIVKAPWSWDTEGYLGPVDGWFWEWVGDREGDEFILAPKEIGRDIASVDVRFWIENDYCRSGGQGTHSTNAIRVRAAMDFVIPGPVQSLTVTGANGEFLAKWLDPLVGAATIDDVAIQYAEDAAFTVGVNTSQDWGDRNSLSGTDPGKTYYWRVAVHNLSDQPSDASTAATLGATGWGPWQAYGAPTAVSSGSGAGLPSDSVIPGPVQNLVITGGSGNYVGDWDDPATGNVTLDDIAIQFASDAAFTQNVNTSSGWGKINHVQSTSPGTTYFFRIAAHNQSGLPSHATTAAALGATGWGPWTAYGAPTAVSSGGTVNAPIDTVIPGPVLGLNVVGRNGEFVATWSDPTTGNMTLDDVALQYCTDAAFTTNGPGSPAKGWGKVNQRQGTDPGKTYYWRVAVHNQSGMTSDASTASALGPTGWGPWTAFASNPVLSGLVPQVENIVFNGGFEIDNGATQAAGWIRDFEVGAPGCTYGLIDFDPFKHEGKRAAVIFNNTTGKAAMASISFPVRPGEVLDYSVWVYLSGSQNNGFYLRVLYHQTNPDFLRTDTVTLEELFASAAPPVGSFGKFEKRAKPVPAGFFFARVALYNWGNTDVAADMIYDDLQVLRVISGNEILDNTIPPSRITGEGRTQFVETFDEGRLGEHWAPEIGSTGANWDIRSGPGVDGGKVFHANGAVKLKAQNFMIPFDPRKLYRMTLRLRAISWTNATTSVMWSGIDCYDANKVALSPTAYVCYNGYNGYGIWVAEQWYEATGFFKGGGTGPNPAPDPTNPAGVPTGTAYISPNVHLSWAGSASASTDQMECDDIRIDILEETQYTSPAPNGTLSSQTVRSYYQYNDPLSSTASLYWYYTQGLVKADQFAITISDGSATWVHRVKSIPNFSGPYELAVYRLSANRTYSVKCTPESIGAAGVAAQIGIDWSPFTPNGNYGTSPSGIQVVGQLDWAGGNVWYDSYQYRNNLPPTNGISATIGATFLHHGSGGQYVTITNINYTQGTPNIATHIAVLVREGGGTIVLNQDMVVSYISMGSLPSSYVVPLNLADNRPFTVGIAAVAECKNGRIFNTSFQPYSKPINAIWIQCTNAPSDGLGRRIIIGHTSGGDQVELHSPPIGLFESGVKRGRLGGDAYGVYLANPEGTHYLYVAGVNTGLRFYTFPGATQGALGFCHGYWEPSYGPPMDGGMIYSHGGQGAWVGPNGSRTFFGAAGPHCGKCGYDFWLVSADNGKWGASLNICGWCGAIYKKGPKKVLNLLTEQEKSEIIGGQNAISPKPKRSLRRRDTRREGQCDKGRVRSARRRSLRVRHKNTTA